MQASEPPFAGFRATLSTYLQASEPPLYIVCPRFSFSAPLHELSWRFPAIWHIGFHGIKAYLSIAAHACGCFAQCSNTIYSMTDIAKLPGNAAQPSCSGFEKENLPPDSRLWRLYPNPHIVCPMLSSLQISGWLSCVKTVALKRENIHLAWTHLFCGNSRFDFEIPQFRD